MTSPDAQFVSEPIQPESGRFDPAMMTLGLASLPAAFVWRGQRYEIVECLDHVKQSMHEGYTTDGERYLRRQTFTVKLDSGQQATLYFERHAARGSGKRPARRRWFLYTITATPDDQET